MDSFEFNKIAGIVLGTLLMTFGIGIFSNIVFSNPAPVKPGYDLPAGEDSHGAAAKAPAADAVPLPKLLAAADVKKGENAVKPCAACHTFDKGGANKTGPNLYGVIDRTVASHEGFAYSDAMKAHGGKWTYQALDAFIANPKTATPGTKMAFGGEKSPEKRADMLAYLRTLAETPAPLPQ